MDEGLVAARLDEVLAAVDARRLGAPTPLEGGFTNTVVAVTTNRGELVVKLVDELAVDPVQLLRGAEIEVQVHARGLAVPEPLLADGRPVVDGGDCRARVHRRVPGTSPDSGVAPLAVARRVGAFLAELHGLALEPTADRAPVASASAEQWARWRRQLSELGGIDEVAWRAAALVGERPDDRHEPLIATHRDLFPRNAVVDGQRLWVCDWDSAGAWTASEEVAAAAVEWSGGILGPADRPCFTALVEGYLEGGGRAPRCGAGLYRGWLVRELVWLERHLGWAADPPDPHHGELARRRLPFLVPRFVRHVDEVPRWLDWLAAG